MRIMHNAQMTSKIWGRVVEATNQMQDVDRSPFLQKACGVSQPSVSKWKNGINTPSLTNCIDISIATGVCVQWIYTGEGPKMIEPAEDSKIAALLDILRELNEDDRAEVLNFAAFRQKH